MNEIPWELTVPHVWFEVKFRGFVEVGGDLVGRAHDILCILDGRELRFDIKVFDFRDF